ncbi:MAG TPA: VanZ family protein [Gemmatimonadaceae bacterium]
MTNPAPLPRAVVWSFIALAVIAVLVPTLAPAGGEEPEPLVYCIVCGEQGVADALTNLILFLPLGAALGLTGGRSRWLIVAGALLSGAIETTQLIIPGRDPSIGDLLFNTLGTAVGLVILRTAASWLAPRRPHAALLGAAAAAVTMLGLSSWALQPDLPESRYFGQWTPNLGHLTWYRARVLHATLGDLPLPPRHLADSAAVRTRLLEGTPLSVRGIAGPRTGGLGSLFSIYDDRHREIVLLGPDRDDLVLRYRIRAAGWGLDAPDLRLLGAMRNVHRGDTLSIAVRRTPQGWCLASGDTTACNLGYTPGRAWALLMYPEGFPQWLRRLLDAGWMAALLVPVGLWARRDAATLGAALAVIVASAAFPAVLGLRRPTALEWAGVAAGYAAGLGIATLARKRGGHALPPRSP